MKAVGLGNMLDHLERQDDVERAPRGHHVLDRQRLVGDLEAGLGRVAARDLDAAGLGVDAGDGSAEPR